MRKLAAGNWKMNGSLASLGEISALIAAHEAPACDLLICPPATLLAAVSAKAEGSALATGGQDCHAKASGAHTGDLSAAMLKEAGAAYVILGHSERRADHGESDALIREKTLAAWQAGLIAVVCIGETLAERESGAALAVTAAQLEGSLPDGATAANCVIAYEPVWAIGTGRIASTAQIAEIHAAIRDTLSARFGAEAAGMRILYGGSVKPDNAAEIFTTANVDGALVGGASLKAADFSAIITALSKA